MCLVSDKTEKNYTNILKEEIRRKYGVSSSNKYPVININRAKNPGRLRKSKKISQNARGFSEEFHKSFFWPATNLPAELCVCI